MSAATILVAGAPAADAEALRVALAAHGHAVAVAEAADEARASEVVADVRRRHGGIDVLVLNAGRSWHETEDAWLECVHAVDVWTVAALPALASTGSIMVSGPIAVSAPGPGYAQYVKARFVLLRYVRQVEREDGGVRAIVSWPSVDADATGDLSHQILELVSGTMRRTAAPGALRSPGVALRP